MTDQLFPLRRRWILSINRQDDRFCFFFFYSVYFSHASASKGAALCVSSFIFFFSRHFKSSLQIHLKTMEIWLKSCRSETGSDVMTSACSLWMFLFSPSWLLLRFVRLNTRTSPVLVSHPDLWVTVHLVSANRNTDAPCVITLVITSSHDQHGCHTVYRLQPDCPSLSNLMPKIPTMQLFLWQLDGRLLCYTSSSQHSQLA